MSKKKNKKTIQKEKKCVNRHLFYIYDSSNNMHEYTIIHTEWDNKETEYELNYSDSPPWQESIRGTRALSIIDHGNGFIFSRNFGVEVNYNDFLELKLLMNFIFNTGNTLSPEYYMKKLEETRIKI